MNSRDKLILTAASAAVGVIVGLLLAPEKGTDLQKKIKSKGRDVADSLNGAYETVSKQFTRVKHDAEELGDEAKQSVRKTTNSILS